MDTETSITETITDKYPKAASVVQQVCKALNGIEIPAGCTVLKVGEISAWTCIMNRAEESRAKFAKL
jgi:hypothetical protein